MKYSLIFAATAAVEVAALTPAQPEQAKPNSGYITTISPGYGKDCVTITQQHQAYPTCVSKNGDGKACDKWGEDQYVSTTIKDYNGKDVCITKMDQPVTVYYEKKTITHTTTVGYGGYATPSGYSGAKPTGSEYKIDDKGCWNELYEKVETIPYNKMGANALKGYAGPGVCKDSDNNQPKWVKEYKDGKWSESTTTAYYGKPTAYVTNFDKKGVYTVPAKDMTVYDTMYYGAEVTKTAKAGETCVYGGKWAKATATGTSTYPYGCYETNVVDGKTKVDQVVKYTTIYVSQTGKVEVCKPTTTVYDKATTWAYPTASYYKPGVYHYDAKVVTADKDNYAYTCEYEQRKYQATGAQNNGYPSSYPTYVPANGNPGYKPATPPYPAKGNSTWGNAAPSGYPSNGQTGYPSQGQPGYPSNGQPGYPSNGQPGYPSQGQPGYPSNGKPDEDCDEEEEKKKNGWYTGNPTSNDNKDKYPQGTSNDNKNGWYPGKPTDNKTTYPQVPSNDNKDKYPQVPSNDNKDKYPTTPSNDMKDKYPTGTPSKPDNSYPAKPSETPCDEETKGKTGYPAKGY